MQTQWRIYPGENVDMNDYELTKTQSHTDYNGSLSWTANLNFYIKKEKENIFQKISNFSVVDEEFTTTTLYSTARNTAQHNTTEYS